MAKKSIIQFDYDWDFTLIGIVTTARDYQFCWQLNKLLDLKLKKRANIEMNLKKKNKLLEFCHFRFDDEMDKLEFHIIGNKFMGENLVPEYKMMDFLLLIKGGYPREKKEKLILGIKSLASVTTLVEIIAEELKSRENLIIE